MDPRREAAQIFKHFDRYHKDMGEALIYYRFDADDSQYDTVYDEGFRRYHVGVRIAILWVDQQEAVEDYAPEGRRPTPGVRVAPSRRAIDVRGGHLGHRGPRQPTDRHQSHRRSGAWTGCTTSSTTTTATGRSAASRSGAGSRAKT